MKALTGKFIPVDISLARSIQGSLGLCILLVLSLVTWQHLPITNHGLRINIDNSLQALGPLLMVAFCVRSARRFWSPKMSLFTTSPPSQRAQRWVPTLLVLGILCYGIGHSIWTYYEGVLPHPPFLSWADVAYMCAYPFLAMGILLLPFQRLSPTALVRTLLDNLMIMIAVVIFSGYFLLGPMLLQAGNIPIMMLVRVLYPICDLVLICCLLLLWVRFHYSVFRPVVHLLILSFAIIIIAHSIFLYQRVHHTNATGGFLDVGLPLGYMLLGVAIQMFHIAQLKQRGTAAVAATSQLSSAEVVGNLPSVWRSSVPYALVPVVAGLLVYVLHAGRNGVLELIVYIGGLLLIGLVLLRQAVTTSETSFYARRMQQLNEELGKTHQRLQEKNVALSGANRQLEEQARQLEAAYQQQHYLNELKDQFLMNVNHELRTPLTAVYGYLELLQGFGGPLDAVTQATYLTRATHGCEELLHLVGNILDTVQGDSPGRAPHCEDLSVATVVRDALDLVDPQKRQAYSFALEIPETLTVKADQDYLHQILLNLLSNAFKYAPSQTRVVVCTMQSESTIQEIAGSSRVCICVQDAGPGIPPEEIPLLFEKFVRLKRDLGGPVRGTGLGLYISKQLVEAMGGRIWVESSGKPGEGSRFCFTLPK